MDWIKRKPTKRILKADSLTKKIAKIRGIENIEEFLNPPINVLHDPYLLNNIREVAERIKEAVLKGERIAVSADVDADGVTSTAILVDYLSQFTDNVYYVYHQRAEGHGVEYQVDKIDDETKLVVVLDSSTNSVKGCKQLVERGMDVLVIDHHDFEVENPYATIVNPQMDDYPNKAISGAGVTYKVVQVLDDSFGTGMVEDYLDLVAVGIVADVMNLSVMENRRLIMDGITNIQNEGLKAILDNANVKFDEVSSTTIGFSIAPLINGVARMDKIELAIELLLERDPLECKKIVKQMVKLNDDRKKKEIELMKMYEEQVNPNDKIIIAIGNDPSKSFNGLVANKIAQKYKRPAIVARDFGDKIAGSFRSMGDFNMNSYLKRTGLVKKSVGHPFAGGVEVVAENVEELREYFNEHINMDIFLDDIEYDLEMKGRDVTMGFVEELQEINRIAGNGFDKVKVRVTDLMVDERKVMGKNKDTVKLVTNCLDAIRFRENSEYANDVDTFDNIEIVGELNINEFFHWGHRKNIVTIQVILDDYRHM
ncbi:DHH family phosphoesterase [Bacillus cereus]|nr:DHH family phosphoesterase [Bacillus cereus]